MKICINGEYRDASAIELAEAETQRRESRIAELKALLFESDYNAIKYAEGETTAEEFEPHKLRRRAYREEINLLEAEEAAAQENAEEAATSEFVNKLKDIAENYDTLYVMACFGAPLNSSTAPRYLANSYNARSDRTEMINAAVERGGVFGFDCVCLVKGVLWGWCGDLSHQYGGASYASNGVGDLTIEQIVDVCTDVSDDFSTITPGEFVWLEDFGHCGVYVGDGKVIESTPAFLNKVQYTACGNIGSINGLPSRTWFGHGKLPFIN